MIKTKIVATLGPASSSPDSIEKLIQNGVDVFRINFSHSTLDEHAVTLANLNAVRARHPVVTAVMGDLGGPKIRTSVIEPEGEQLTENRTIEILSGDAPGKPNMFGTTYPRFVEDVQPGHRILIDDGNLLLSVESKQPDRLIAKVLVGGPIYSRKGINLPDTHVSVQSVTEKDWRCIDWAIKNNLNFLALSFVRQADELREVKKYLREHKSDIQLISKIEKPQAVANLEEIIDASDAVLVARGDLGVEMDLAEVPLIQKRITHLCRKMEKPVIVATQMLQSMIERPVPTRAEVSDVANAVLDLTDAIMLSGETAVGKYPVESVQWMNRIAECTETWLTDQPLARHRALVNHDLAATESMARSVAQIVEDTKAKFVVALSESGTAVRLLSKARIDVPVIGISSNARICEQMNLQYGVVPFCHVFPGDMRHFAEITERILRQKKLVQKGDQIILVAGKNFGAAGAANTIMVYTLT